MTNVELAARLSDARGRLMTIGITEQAKAEATAEYRAAWNAWTKRDRTA